MSQIRRAQGGTGEVITNHFEIYGPDNGTVQAWAAEYVPHQPKDWKKTLATEITTRCRGLRPEDGQVLHASFFGKKKVNADVENLVLYNIGAFGKASDNGIRFEHGAGVPPAPSGTQYPFCYRYELVPEDHSFRAWQPRETLASFDWINLGEFKGEKLAAPAWLALARAYERGQAEVFRSDLTTGTEFAVRIHIRPPGKHTRVLSNMVKGIVDGTVSAFQAHTDLTVLPRVIPPLVKAIHAASPALEADIFEVERHLREQGRGVLGEVAQLISPNNGGGFAFAPDDPRCVVGELIRTDPPGDLHWAIKGNVVEVSRRHVG